MADEKEKAGITSPELPWKLYSLEMDPAGRKIGQFLGKKGYPVKRKTIDPLIRIINTDCKPTTGNIYSQVLSAVGAEGRVLAAYGSGNLHHYTYGLCRRVNQLNKEFGYIHIDHHTDGAASDASSKEEGILWCGDFVNRIVSDTNVGKKDNMLLIGAYRSNINCMLEPDLRRQYGWQELESMVDALPDNVYVTMDLDVMGLQYITTDFMQGNMTPEELIAILNIIRAKKRIIGADICGLEHSGMYPDGLMIYDAVIAKMLGMESKGGKNGSA